MAGRPAHQVFQVLDLGDAIAVELELAQVIQAHEVLDLDKITIAEEQLFNFLERHGCALACHLLSIALCQLQQNHAMKKI